MPFLAPAVTKRKLIRKPRSSREGGRSSSDLYPSLAQVGGIKDKVLAAHRAGLKRVIIPQRNEKDLEEIPGNVRQDLSFVTASCLDDVLNAAFDGGFAVKSSPLVSSKL